MVAVEGRRMDAPLAAAAPMSPRITVDWASLYTAATRGMCWTRAHRRRSGALGTSPSCAPRRRSGAGSGTSTPLSMGIGTDTDGGPCITR